MRGTSTWPILSPAEHKFCRVFGRFARRGWLGSPGRERLGSCSCREFVPGAVFAQPASTHPHCLLASLAFTSLWCVFLSLVPGSLHQIHHNLSLVHFVHLVRTLSTLYRTDLALMGKICRKPHRAPMLLHLCPPSLSVLNVLPIVRAIYPTPRSGRKLRYCITSARSSLPGYSLPSLAITPRLQGNQESSARPRT